MEVALLNKDEFATFIECSCGYTEQSDYMIGDSVCPDCGVDAPDPGYTGWEGKYPGWREVVKKPINFRLVRNPAATWWNIYSWFVTTCDWEYRKGEEPSTD